MDMLGFNTLTFYERKKRRSLEHKLRRTVSFILKINVPRGEEGCAVAHCNLLKTSEKI
jgi:hypothetical protein